MKPSREVYDRMKTMLVKDKLGVGDGFQSIFKTDLERLCGDFFNLDGKINLNIELLDDGKYQVNVSFQATETKGFCSTLDTKRGIY